MLVPTSEILYLPLRPSEFAHESKGVLLSGVRRSAAFNKLVMVIPKIAVESL
jgi:hypothetical protein